ncbi:MAG: hypothetical protein R2878_12035 [Thermoleophilia bacterium]
MASPAGTTTALRCRLEEASGAPTASLTTALQLSHVVSSLVDVDGLALITPDVEVLRDGQPVPVVPVR